MATKNDKKSKNKTNNDHETNTNKDTNSQNLTQHVLPPQNAAGQYMMQPVFTYASPGSPVLPMGMQPQQQGASISVTGSEFKLLMDKLNAMDAKLSKLDKIKQSVSHLREKIKDLDKKISEIDSSQTFICKKSDELFVTQSKDRSLVNNLESQFSIEI